MGRSDAAVTLAIAVMLPVAAAAAAPASPRVSFAVPAGPLEDGLIAIGRQAGVTVGLGDAALGRLGARGVAGRMTVSRALEKILDGLPARAERIDAQSWRIVGAEPLRARPVPIRGPSPGSRRPGPSSSSAEIVVSATKRDTLLDHYAGTAYVLGGETLAAARDGTGSDAVVARLPTLASTALGPGRNKLFIRGIADSSFNGPSQATVGQYLDDIRLNYNAPDPNLTLVDVRRVEVLEGPQGTLYGAGTLGGVIRVVPEPVQLDRAEGILAAGHGFTSHGEDSGDLSAVLNLPLVTGAAAVRGVAYRSVDGGYIDDVGRGLRNVNRTVTVGGRLAIRVAPGDGWTIDGTGLVQNIDSDDGQYAERGLPPLTRSSRIAQPFDSDYALIGLSAAKDFGRASFHSSTGLVFHDVDSTYDFTPGGGAPTLFSQRNRIRLFTTENRLSRRDDDGAGWVVGLGILHDEERLTRALGPVAAPARILGVSNSVSNFSGYGEIGFRLRPALVVTAGVRLDFAHLAGEALDRSDDDIDVGEPRRDKFSVLPSLALAWHPRPGATVFARYQEGFRPGDLAVAGNGGTLSVQRFRGDSLSTYEAGGRIERDRFDGTVTVSYAHWENIQADLVDASGLPLTANIGNGHVLGLEAQAGWRLVDAMRLEAAVFVNDSELTSPSAGLISSRGSALPNVAKLGARAALEFRVPAGSRLVLTGGASVRYVGASRLGAGPALSLPQGRYFNTAANLRLGTETLGITLDASNLLGGTGNRFALGDPFDVADGRQIVPLRPRTVRLGFDVRF